MLYYFYFYILPSKIVYFTWPRKKEEKVTIDDFLQKDINFNRTSYKQPKL